MSTKSITVGRPFPMDKNVEMYMSEDAAECLRNLVRVESLRNPNDSGIADMLTALEGI